MAGKLRNLMDCFDGKSEDSVISDATSKSMTTKWLHPTEVEQSCAPLCVSGHMATTFFRIDFARTIFWLITSVYLRVIATTSRATLGLYYIRGLLHKTFTGGKTQVILKVNGKFMLTGVFRFYQSFFSPVKVLCNGPQVIMVGWVIEGTSGVGHL